MQDISALRRKLIHKTRKEVKEKYTGKDVHIIRAINVLDDLDSVFNLLAEHAREWYGAHFPELERAVNDNEKYMKFALELGNRKHFTVENAGKELAEKATTSMGSDIDESSLKEIQLLCKNALEIKAERNEIARFIEDEMRKLMPNFAILCGGILGAKMLNEAGSLRRLALMPSSTIQVLGAEKALFKHIKSGTKPPKYGHLYQHPLVKKVPASEKGKMARTLAGKLSIAAKEDFFGGKGTHASLQKELDTRANSLCKK